MSIDIKYETIEVIDGVVGPHLTEYGRSRRVSLVGVLRNEDGSPSEVVHLTGILDLNHESNRHYEDGTPFELLEYGGKPKV